MAGVLQHLRSSTLDKRPNPASMVDGQVAINYASGAPGMFFKDSNGSLVKVGPVHVGTTAPNVSPASGGTAGNSRGEQWLDTTGGTYVFKIWDGSAWRSESGTFVDTSGDTMTGALGIIAGSASTPGLFFSGDTNTGIYSPGADQLAISTNGTGRLFVDASGRVGVGVGSPVTALQVVGIATFGNGVGGRLQATTDSNLGYIDSLNNTSTEWQPLLQRGTEVQFHTNTAGVTPVEKVRITSAGLVGVGTSTPGTVGGGATLNIEQAGGARLVMNSFSRRFYVTGASGADDLRIGRRISTDTVDSDSVTITGGGNVGIGTTSPQNTLVVSNAGAEGLEIVPTGGTPNVIAFNRATAAYAPLTLNGSVHILQTSGTERLRIDSSGRLLVGTSSARSNFFNTVYTPQFQLEGVGQQQSMFSLVNSVADNGGSVIAFGKQRSGTIGGNTIVNSGDTVGQIDFFGSDGTEMVALAEISASVDGTPGANDMPGRLVFSTTADGASSPTERMRIGASGNVGIGVADGAGARLTVTSTGTAYAGYFNYPGSTAQGIGLNSTGAGSSYAVYFFNDGANVGSIYTTASTTAYNTSSDYRLKENVVSLTGAIDRINDLQVRRFNFIADPDRTVDGFIAHEAQAVVPECVTGEKDAVDGDGNPVYQGIDQSKLVPLLTAALQEAIGRIETLEAKVAALEGV